MHILSAAHSTLLKYFFPFVAVVGAWAWVYWPKRNEGTESLIMALALLAALVLIMYFKLRKGFWRLADTVEDRGDRLAVTRWRTTIEIPLSQIREIMRVRKLVGSEVILILREPCVFGAEISFLAPDKRKVPGIDEALDALSRRAASHDSQRAMVHALTNDATTRGLQLPAESGVNMSYPEDFDDLLLSRKADFARLAPKVQVAYCLHRLEAQVNNGGFHQFFSNSTGEYVLETIQALLEIGAVKTSELLKRAVLIGFPAGYPRDASQYESAVADFDDVSDELDVLDQEFFRYAEPLTDLVNKYLQKGTQHG